MAVYSFEPMTTAPQSQDGSLNKFTIYNSPLPSGGADHGWTFIICCRQRSLMFSWCVFIRSSVKKYQISSV